MTEIGRYEILEELGRGGFATVFKARDSQLNRLVSLKVLHAGWSGDPDFVRRFRQEAETVANLRHPNIVVIHDVGEIDRQLFIAMEYLPGVNLQSWLDHQAGSRRPLGVPEALPLLRQIGAALDYAHGQGIIHRDVKPSNVMIQDEGMTPHVVLTDFGLVKAMENSVALTTSGETLGSPEYMAPEQADPNRREEVGPHSDLYALGILAYRMLAGRVPFPGHSISTLNAHANLDVPPPQEFNSDLSDQTAAILLKMLAKSPADRYPSAAAFVEALAATTQAESRAQQLQVQVAPLYARLQQAHSDADWVEVVSLAGQIVALLPGYQDVAQLQADARRELKRPQAIPLAEKESDSETPSAESEPGPERQASPAAARPIATVGEEPTAREFRGMQRLRELPITVWGIAALLLIGLVWLGFSIAYGPETDATPASEVEGSIPPPNPQLGDTWTRPIDDMVMVYVPPPEAPFALESGVDAPQEGYWIDRFEVSNAQYQLCVDAGACEVSDFASDLDFNGADYPVVGVSWQDASNYSAWAGGELPTEAEWEYAAVGDTGTAYPWGDDFDGTRLNFCDANCPHEWADEGWDDGYAVTAPVGSNPAGESWVGASDMAGNVWEWTASLKNSLNRVVRGGSWGSGRDAARAAFRASGVPFARTDLNGFRVVVRFPPSQ